MSDAKPSAELNKTATPIDPGNSVEIHTLILQSDSLAKSVDHWNIGYILAGGIAVAVAFGILGIQWRIIAKGKQLSDVQNSLLSAKDRQLKIALDQKDKDIAAADDRRVKLANRILDIFGPRQLTPEQSAHIVKGLTGLEGVKIDVYVYGVDNPYTLSDFEDSRKIGVEVVRILQRAHVDAAGWLLKDCHGASATGLVIATTGDDAEDTRIGSLLIKAFQRETGTDPNVEKMLSPPNWCTTTPEDLDKSAPNKRQHDAKISIIVGRKFAPILTPEMLEWTDEQNKL